MNVLDENILASQRQQLQQWRIRVRQIGLGTGARYCLVLLDVGRTEVATYVRRVLRHPDFNTRAKRLGPILRASPAGITVWRLHAERELRYPWHD